MHLVLTVPQNCLSSSPGELTGGGGGGGGGLDAESIWPRVDFFWTIRNFSQTVGVRVHPNFGVQSSKVMVYKSWTRSALLKAPASVFW